MSSGFARQFLVPEFVKNVCAHVCAHLCVLKQSPVQTGTFTESHCQQKSVYTGDIDRKTGVK